MECLVAFLHVTDTCSSALKNIIYSVLPQLSLSYSRKRGQGYDGASSTRGHINGLGTLIGKDCPSTHYIHCFAHQLQLPLVAVAHNSVDVGEFLEIVVNLLNTVGGSYIHRHLFREKQVKKLLDKMNKGEQVTGKDVIVVISKYGKVSPERARATDVIRSIQTFDFVFVLHLMNEILEITNVLSQSLQRRVQDILNAIILLVSAKRQLLEKRGDEGWASFMRRVSSFCVRFSIELPIMDRFYLNMGEISHTVSTNTNYHHYRVEVFNDILVIQYQELRCRFPEGSTKLLIGIACLNHSNSFRAFKKEKLVRMAELYQSDFDEVAIRDHRVELDTFIFNVHNDERIFNLKGLSDLSKKFVETQKHSSFPNMHLLVNLALILPVSTATVERVFSAMKLIKNDLRNKISDEFLNDAVITYFENEKFEKVSDDSVIDYFQKMKLRREQF